jgi:Protein of unknown function (DUF3592)
MLPSIFIFTFIGILLIAYAVVAATLARRARNWGSVNGKIVATTVTEFAVIGAYYSLWRPCIQYSYEINGITKLDTKLSLDEHSHKFGDKREAQKFLSQYPEHKVVQIYHSANGDVTLLNDINWARKSHYLAVGIAGTLILFSGLILAFIL